MTREALNGTPVYNISGRGPYTIEDPYRAPEDIRVEVTLQGVTTLLSGNSYEIDPASSDDKGTVQLSELTATMYQGGQLLITRDTRQEQGWTGQTAREKGLEAQLDVLTMGAQDLRGQVDSAYKSPVGTKAGTINPGASGSSAVFDNDGNLVPGPVTPTFVQSAYMQSKADGFVGTFQDWLASLNWLNDELGETSKVYASRVLAQAAEVADSVHHIAVLHDQVFCLYQRSTVAALTTADGSTWGPAIGHATYYAHWGLDTYSTSADALAAVTAMDMAERAAHQQTIQDATFATDGRLVLDGYLEILDASQIGSKVELELAGGLVGEVLQGGFVVTPRFNMAAEGVLIGGKTGTGRYAASVFSAHIQFRQDAAMSSGDVADVVQYPKPFVAKEAFGLIGAMRVTGMWGPVDIEGPSLTEQNGAADNTGGWEIQHLQVAGLNSDVVIGNALHFVKIGRIDSWVWGLLGGTGALAEIRNREVSAGVHREAIRIGRCDSFLADHIGAYQGGRIVIDKGDDASITDQIGSVQLDGDYASLEHRSGRTQIGQVYGTEKVSAPTEGNKIHVLGGKLVVAAGSLVGDADNLVLVEGDGSLKYTGTIRNTNNRSRAALVRENGRLILDGCHFVIEDAAWQVGFIEQQGNGELVIRDCTAEVRGVGPVDVWSLVKFNSPTAGCSMDSHPRTRADMAGALVGDLAHKFLIEPDRVYDLDALPYVGRVGAGVGTSLPGLKALGATPANDILSKMNVAPSAVIAKAVQDHVTDLRSHSTLWDKMTGYFVPCLHDTQASGLNWKDLARAPLSFLGGAYLVPNAGANMRASNAMLRTGIDAAQDLAGDSVHIGVYVHETGMWLSGTSGAVDRPALGCAPTVDVASPARHLRLDTHYGSDQRIAARLNTVPLLSFGDVQSVKKHTGGTIATRDGETAYAYRDGVRIASLNVGATVNNATGELVVGNSGDQWSDYPFQIVHCGQHLTDAEVAYLHASQRAFLTALGIIVEATGARDARSDYPVVPTTTSRPPAATAKSTPFSFDGFLSDEANVGTQLSYDGIIVDGVDNQPRHHYDPYTSEYLGLLVERGFTPTTVASGDGSYQSEDLTGGTYAATGLVRTLVSPDPDNFRAGGVSTELLDTTDNTDHAIEVEYTLADNRSLSAAIFVKEVFVANQAPVSFYIEITRKDGGSERACFLAGDTFVRSKTAGIINVQTERYRTDQGWFRYHIAADVGAGGLNPKVRFGILPPAYDNTIAVGPTAYAGNASDVRGINVSGWNVSDRGLAVNAVMQSYTPQSGAANSFGSDNLEWDIPVQISATEGTWQMKFHLTGIPQPNGSFARLLRVEDAAGDVFFEIRQNGTTGDIIATSDGGLNFVTLIPYEQLEPGKDFNLLYSYTSRIPGSAENRSYWAVNGSKVFNSDNDIGPDHSKLPTRVFVGCRIAADRLPFAVREINYWPARLPIQEQHHLVGYRQGLSTTGHAQIDLYPNDPVWMATVLDQIGITSNGTSVDNPEVMKYHEQVWSYFSRTSLSDGVDYCSAGASWTMEQHGISGTGNIKAHSWQDWGRKLAAPQYGSVVLTGRRPEDDGAFAGIGHVAFYGGDDPDTPGNFLMVGYNQRVLRVMVSTYPKAQIIEARWPTEKELVGYQF